MQLDEFLASQGVKRNGLEHAATGNTTAAIMAIPMATDSIRLIGDEDKHATILYFGETATLPADAKNVLIDTLGMVARMTPPFAVPSNFVRIRPVTSVVSLNCFACIKAF